MVDVNAAATNTVDMITGALNQAKNQNGIYDAALEDIKNTEATQFGGDFDSLQSAFNMGDLTKTDWTRGDIRNKTGLQEAGEIMMTSGKGAMAGGAVYPGWGHLIGGVAGLIAGGFGAFKGNQNARKAAARLNERAKEANAQYLSNFSNSVQNATNRAFNSAALNIAAYGGMLNDNSIDNFTKAKVRLAAFGGDIVTPYANREPFDNGVTKVEEGGSHETNPFSGVLMGVSPTGTPNLVEEGEVVYNDYVYSNRLSPTEEQLEEVKLPTKYAGKPYSYIAEKLQEESERSPIDSISRNSLADSMMKLTTIQEQSRERDQEYQAFENLEGLFAEGGKIYIKPSKRGTFTAAAKKRGMGVQEFASKVLANKDSYSPEMVKKANFARNAAKWHAFGGPIGNLFAGPGERPQWMEYWNPIYNDYGFGFAPRDTGTLAQDVVPVQIQEPAVSNKSTKSKPRTVAQEPITVATAEIPASGKEKTKEQLLNSLFGNPNWRKTVGQKVDLTQYAEEVQPETVNDEPIPYELSRGEKREIARNTAKARGEYGGDWGITALRAAPVAGSAMQALSDALGWTNKPNYAIARTIGDSARRIRTVTPRPIGNYMTYKPMDVDYLLNRLQNQNLGLQRAALDMASGNAGAARNAMFVANRAAADQEGDAYRKALEYNDAQRKSVQQFNAAIDQFNAQQGLQADVYNQRRDEAITEAMIRQAQMMDAIESAASQARSANITGFYNNVGQFGNDRLYADMVREYPQLMGLYNDRVRQSLPTYIRACGGKLKRVKEFKR